MAFQTQEEQQQKTALPRHWGIRLLINPIQYFLHRCTPIPPLTLRLYRLNNTLFLPLLALSLVPQTSEIESLLRALQFVLTIFPHTIFVFFSNLSIHLLQQGSPPSKIEIILGTFYSISFGSFAVLYSGPTLMSYTFALILSIGVILKYNASTAESSLSKGPIPSSFILRCVGQALIRYKTSIF